MGYHLSDYTISLFPDISTDYHPLYSDFTNHITYDLIGVTPEELYHSAPVGFPAAYSICGALIKINNKYTPMVISTTSSGCRVKNDSTQEIGSYKQVKYNGYGYYVCDNIPGLADNITVQGYMLKEIDKNYNSIEEAVIDFLSRLDKLPTPCKRIYLLPDTKKVKLATATDVFSYSKYLFYGKKQECFYCLYVDKLRHLITTKLLFMGTMERSSVHPREIFKEAYKVSATGIICIHNHPSGVVLPSKKDIEFTNDLVKLGDFHGIYILDHLIVNENKYFSFVEYRNKNN